KVLDSLLPLQNFGCLPARRPDEVSGAAHDCRQWSGRLQRPLELVIDDALVLDVDLETRGVHREKDLGFLQRESETRTAAHPRAKCKKLTVELLLQGIDVAPTLRLELLGVVS